MTRFVGAASALVTPFRDDVLDESALRELTERQLAAGMDFVVPCGTTGESPVLSVDEHARVVEVVVSQVRHRVPVLAGAGANSTKKTIELSRRCQDAGADGLLLVCPYYNKPSQAGLVAHFRAVLDAVPLPAVLYDIPARTGISIEFGTYEALAEIAAVVGVKEASGNILAAQRIVARYGDRFDVLSGDDALTLGMMAVGAVGLISVAGNLLPGPVAEVVHRVAKGELAQARALHQRLLPIHEALFAETNPSPIKAALAAQGLIAPELRLPLVWPTEATRRRLEEVLEASEFRP
ncbi:MAG: 4-hydroxy-tetrahydrodipicolinate synthase [Deltaproteobacteria bacterium]|nr:4-hydroxy-tetrahydrodipicolinate synthase [Deltaproteobacteria bacterium]